MTQQQAVITCPPVRFQHFPQHSQDSHD